MEILINNIEEIYTGDRVIEDGYIIIKNDRITELGTDIVEENHDFDRIIAAEDMVALPGLINCHSHSAMTLLRGYADDLPLHTWLEEKIWPAEANLSVEDIYWGSMLAIMEMISTGTTTFADMYFEMQMVARAVEKSGIRAVLCQGLIEDNDGPEGLKAGKRFAGNWQGEADGRITTMLGPHAPYTCSPGYLKKIKSAAAGLNIPIHIHVAETEEEINIIRENYGCTPVEYLVETGIITHPLLAAHCVHVNDRDIDILRDNDVGVVHNPKSNLKLSSGIAPVAGMLQKGLTVGVGTDGAASNNNLDLLEEGRFASYLQKMESGDPTVLDMFTVLTMLTANGAEILRLPELGKINTGYKADLILVNTGENEKYYPHHSNLSNIMYSGNGRAVETVIVNGAIVFEGGEFNFIDRERVLYEAERRAEKLIN